jgi:hypothetical protein
MKDRRHQPDGKCHALRVMNVTPLETELPIAAGQKTANVFTQNRASIEAPPVMMPENAQQIGSESRRREGREQIEARIEYLRPKAAFAFPLVAVCSLRNAGTGGSGNRPRTGGGSKSRNRHEGGIHGSGLQRKSSICHQHLP